MNAGVSDTSRCFVNGHEHPHAEPSHEVASRRKHITQPCTSCTERSRPNFGGAAFVTMTIAELYESVRTFAQLDQAAARRVARGFQVVVTPS